VGIKVPGIPGHLPGSARFSDAFFVTFAIFITSRSRSESMQDIISSKKMENGIVVFWDEKNQKMNESFNYAELVDMKINALDLLERPKSYKVDKDAHKLIVKK
jgi:hypothetical protein